MYHLYLVPLVPVHQPLLLDQQPPPHVATVEVAKLYKVIMDIYKTEDDCTDNAEGEDDDNDGNFLLIEVISK